MAIAAADRRRPSSIRCRPFRLRADDGRPASRFVGPRGALTKMARSGDELPEAAGVDPSANLHGDPSPRAHAPTPEGVPVGVAHRHVDVRPAADARRDVVDPELQVLVHGGLQGERPDDVLLDAGRREILLRDHVLLEEGLRLLPILLEGSRGEEPPLELLDFVRQLDDREALDVPRVLDPLGGREFRLLEEPIVAAFLLALLRPEQVAAPVERDQAFVLDLTEIAVRREGAVRDEDRIQIAELSLDLLGEDVLEFPEHERLVHGAAARPTVLVSRCAEVSRVRRLPSSFAYDERPESFLDRTVADVEGGMRTDRRDLNPGGIVAFEHLDDRLAINHPAPIRVAYSPRP